MGHMDARRAAERVPDAAPPSLVVRHLTPAVEGGRYAVKRLLGDALRVGADLFKDGHDTLAGSVRVRGPGERRFAEVPLMPLGNDRHGGRFTVDRPGQRLGRATRRFCAG